MDFCFWAVNYIAWLSWFFWGRFSRVCWIFADTTGEIIGTGWEDWHGFFGD